MADVPGVDRGSQGVGDQRGPQVVGGLPADDHRVAKSITVARYSQPCPVRR